NATTRRDMQGNIIGVIGVGQDITERKKAEMESARIAQELTNLIDTANAPIFGIDKEGLVTEWNRTAVAITGYEKRETLGRNLVEEFITEEYKASVKEVLDKALKGIETANYEFPLYTKDRERREVLLNATTRRDMQGNIIGVIGVGQDITERKKLETRQKQTTDALTAWVKALEARNRQATLLSEAGNLLQSCLNLEEAYGIINQFAPKLFPDTPGALFILNSSARQVETVAVWGKPILGQHTFQPENCWALRRGRDHLVEEDRPDLLCRHLSSAPRFGYTCLPLVAMSETLGVLHLQANPELSGKPKDIREQEMESQHRLAKIVSEHFALNLANIKLRETLKFRAIRDPLTGLFNRRYLEETLTRELSRAVRNKETLGVIVLSLENLREFNGSYGHEAGGAVLRTVGDYLLRRTRGEDIACRYSDSEFALVMIGADSEATLLRAEKLREEIKALKAPSGKSASISAGVACYPEHGTTSETLLQAAESALFFAKIEGREGVAVATSK
ncbi:MAG TPA: diguanylate cyclase, partial [Verrucomicrobiae bacterium]|nr:diguanylate cyclase [Verrucomicrobiae bacterium]